MKVDFGTVTERDMDMLFLNAFSSEKAFVNLFISKTDLPIGEYSVDEIYLSKADKDGESDITVVIELNGVKYGLLIEDKIDAQAMPDQQKRYTLRGDRAVKNGEYKEYRDFIVCSKNYYAANDEAKKYSHFVSYEECADCLEKIENTLSEAWVQQIKQAIKKSKRHSETVINENAKIFINKYRDYLEENYPFLDLRTSRESNGYWAEYATRYKYVSMVHKIPYGHIDLTFSRASDKMDGLTNIAKTLNEMIGEQLKALGLGEVIAVPMQKSGTLRIKVPAVENHIVDFESIDKTVLDKWFYVLSLFSKFSNMLASADDVTRR